MSQGLYQYKDLEKNIVVYIGRFTGIERIRAHLWKSQYDKQVINTVLQNNPDRYKSEIICEYEKLTDEELNWMECMEIMKHKFLYDNIPLFNFTCGGEGTSGYRKPYDDFKYTVTKDGHDNNKQRYSIKDRNNKPIKISIYERKLNKIAEKLNNKEITEEEAKNIKIEKDFQYNISKSSNRGFRIYDKKHKPLKTCKEYNKLIPICEALNNGVISEEEVRLALGVNKVIKLIDKKI